MEWCLSFSQRARSASLARCRELPDQRALAVFGEKRLSDFLSGHQFGIGAHLDAIGGFVPDRHGDIDKRVETLLVNLPRKQFRRVPVRGTNRLAIRSPRRI